MTRDVVTISPQASMRDLKVLLRDRRISGVPVVDNGKLIGIISIENLIQALEKNQIDSAVSEHMTRQVHTLRPEDPLVKAVNFFAQYGYGRYPVVDSNGQLVGIITKGDILRATLHQMEVRWEAEEIHRYRASHIFEDIESEETSLVLRYNIKAQDFVRGGEASSKIKRALERLGAPPPVIRRVAVAVYEGETNIIIHSVGGYIHAEIRPDKVTIYIVDYGPGIPDVEQAMQPGFSTAPDWIRELGFGAGMGLINIKNCADTMKLTSKMGEGTRLEISFKLQ